MRVAVGQACQTFAADTIVRSELARPRPSLDRRLRLLRGPNGKMRMVITAVEKVGEEERSDSRGATGLTSFLSVHSN